MKHYRDDVWTVVVVAGVLLLLTPILAHAEDLTLSAAFRDPAGVTGTVAFTVELEPSPAPADTPTPEAHAVPEPSTLVLIGLGVIGLAILGKTRYKKLFEKCWK